MESRPDIPTWYVRQERLEVETTQEIESSIHILMIVQSPFQVHSTWTALLSLPTTPTQALLLTLVH